MGIDGEAHTFLSNCNFTKPVPWVGRAHCDPLLCQSEEALYFCLLKLRLMPVDHDASHNIYQTYLFLLIIIAILKCIWYINVEFIKLMRTKGSHISGLLMLSCGALFTMV